MNRRANSGAEPAQAAPNNQPDTGKAQPAKDQGVENLRKLFGGARQQQKNNSGGNAQTETGKGQPAKDQGVENLKKLFGGIQQQKNKKAGKGGRPFAFPNAKKAVEGKETPSEDKPKEEANPAEAKPANDKPLEQNKRGAFSQ